MQFHLWQFLAVLVAGWMADHQQQVIEYLREENRVLREKLGTQRVRLNDDQRRRLAAKGKILGRRRLAEVCTIVTPDTILRWHRRLIAQKYDGSDRRRPGRPRVMQEIAELVVRIASENERWGYRRIQGALSNLGHTVSRSTVRRVLIEHGIDPAPMRRKRTPWKTFLAAHWESIAAADFFTVEIWTRLGLTRFMVFFVLKHMTREVEIAGISRAPCGAWMEQTARSLTDPDDGFITDTQFLICDRDPLYTVRFHKILKGEGVQVLRLPPRSPDLNAHAERFVRSIKSECLDRMIFFGERHLRRAIDEYMEHYHRERNHQGLDNRLIKAESIAPSVNCGAVQRRQRLGGLLNFYRPTPIHYLG